MHDVWFAGSPLLLLYETIRNDDDVAVLVATIDIIATTSAIAHCCNVPVEQYYVLYVTTAVAPIQHASSFTLVVVVLVVVVAATIGIIATLVAERRPRILLVAVIFVVPYP